MADKCMEKKTHHCIAAILHAFLIFLSTAALHWSAGGLMFARTGSQGSSAEYIVPVIRPSGMLSAGVACVYICV